MFDWQAELAPLDLIPLVHSRSPSTQNVLFALAVPMPSHNVVPPPKSFAAVLGGAMSAPSEEAPYPVPCLKGDALSIKIGQDEYSKGLVECLYALRGRLTLNKGDKPYMARDLATKLGKLCKMVHEWKMISLGRVFMTFFFSILVIYLVFGWLALFLYSRVFFVSLNGRKTFTIIHRNKNMLLYG